MASAAASGGARAAKRELRRAMRRTLEEVKDASIAVESARVAAAVQRLPPWAASRRVGLYLSMPRGELRTSALVAAACDGGKRCFVPRVLDANDMVMLEVESAGAVDAFPRSAWGIPEPPHGPHSTDAVDAGGLDLVVVPGVAFTRDGRRCGHGRGYYDRYLERLRRVAEEKGRPAPVLVAVCLSCQVVADVPVDDRDVRMDWLVTPDATIHCSSNSNSKQLRSM